MLNMVNSIKSEVLGGWAIRSSQIFCICVGPHA